MELFTAARFRQLVLTLLLLLMVTGQMMLLHKWGDLSLLHALGLSVLTTALLFALCAWLPRPPVTAASMPVPAPAPPTPADVVVHCGKTENAQALKELLKEIKGAKELLGSLDEQMNTLSDGMKTQRTFLQRRLRKLRARQRQILDHLGLADTPEEDNGQTLDLTRLFDEEQSTLQHAQLREHLAHVSKDDLNLLLEVIIELLERETAHAVAGDANQKL